MLMFVVISLLYSISLDIQPVHTWQYSNFGGCQKLIKCLDLVQRVDNLLIDKLTSLSKWKQCF